jgi:hypothetical protein
MRIPGINLPHKVERFRLTRYGSPGPLGTRCKVCGQTWSSTPNRIRTACPGVPVFYSWEKAQDASLRTMTQWRKEHRKLKSDATRTAVMDRGPTHYGEWYDLYTEDQTLPMRRAKVPGNPA